MPIYEYQCQKCGVIEVTQRITEKPLVKCPTCKSKIRKLISNTSFQLKGTGWYVTDYGAQGAEQWRVEEREQLQARFDCYLGIEKRNQKERELE